MTRYTKFLVNLSDHQLEKIKKSVMNGCKTSTIRLAYEDLTGDKALALTRSQAADMIQAERDKKGVTLILTRPQLEYNARIEGGFLAALLPLLATAGKFLLSSALPALATGALAGVGSAAGSKAVDKVLGSACYMSDDDDEVRVPHENDDMKVVYIRKNGMPFKITTNGSGLYLAPWKKGSSYTGDGLYIKRGGAFVGMKRGFGLLLGPNSPFKDVPLLGLLL